ncbi:hypothetical protein RB595_003887 [Gaeumannomyces hyphopodioides]
MPAEVCEDVHRQVASGTPETTPLGVGDTSKGVETPSDEQDTETLNLTTSSEISPSSANSSLDGAIHGGASSGTDKDANALGVVVEEGLKGDVSAAPETKQDEIPAQAPAKDDGEEDVGSEKEGSESESSDEERVASRAARLYSTRKLYKALRKRLATREENRAADGDKARDQGHALVTSLADYLRTLEERVAKLEKGGDEPALTEPANTKKGDEADAVPQGVADEGEVLTSFHDYRTEENLIFALPPKGHEGPFSSGEASFINLDSKYVLRVLFGWNGKQGGQESHDILTQPDPGQIEIFGIRINSEPIARFLENKVKYKLDQNSVTQLSKPFRVLLRHAALIRDQLESLEQRYGDAASQSASPIKTASDSEENVGKTATPESQNSQTEDAETAGVPTKGPAESPYDSKVALLHFRELVAFIDKYLGRKVELFNDCRNGFPPTIAFENLWMLFDFGDIVMCLQRRGGEVVKLGSSEEGHVSVQRHVPQAYRVISTAGGIRRKLGFFPSPAPAYGGELVEDDGRPSAAKAWKQPADVNAQQFPSFYDDQPLGGTARYSFTPLQVYCHFVDYNGIQLNIVPEIFEIKPFDGEVEVSTLQVFPIAYRRLLGHYANSPDFHERGLQFLGYTQVTHIDYDGLTVGDTAEEITGPVMVDFALASKENPALVPRCFGKDVPFWGSQSTGVFEIAQSSCESSTMSCCIGDMYSQQEKQRSNENLALLKSWLEDLELGGDKQIKKLKAGLTSKKLAMLLPGVVQGFSLHGRKWLEFDMRYLKAIKRADGDSGWKDLVLPDTHRTMVQSMVETHTRQTSSTTGSEARYDAGLVQGKGKGCIILLHGVPGVGKTSTAECVAAYTRRPLFPITCGDIGYEPVDVEQKLEKLFRLAHKWGCVLLIDEADVFLGERDKADIKRNGLVSVFLRVLEYYSGILFLTTNRVGTFDEAFRSRIHLSLYYPELDQDKSRKVWKVNMKRIDKRNEQREKEGLRSVIYERKEILEWAKLNYKLLSWNGRQIQNAFQTALALAEFEVRDIKQPKKRQPTVTMKHFQTIGSATIEFDNYLFETYLCLDASTIAKKKQLRADAYKMGTTATAQDCGLQMPVPRKPKSKPKPKPTSKQKTETSSSESESSESSSEEEQDTSSEGAESGADEKTKKKGKAKGKRTGKDKDKVKPEADENEKTKDSQKKGTKSKKARKDEDFDDASAVGRVRMCSRE